MKQGTAQPTPSRETVSPPYRVRFVTAASLFDGHDAAINIMRRILQTSGAEVIHLGHNRSVGEIVDAAIQEDAQAIAISSYQGGHVEYFKYTIDLLKSKGADHIKVFGGGGGTITPKEISELEAYGVSKLFSPEDGRKLGLQGIIDQMLEHCNGDPTDYIDWDQLGTFSQKYKALAQALTCIELSDNHPSVRERWSPLTRQIDESSKKGFVVGLTGPGGAGKSSLTDELVWRCLETDPACRIAVLAIDPTRRKTGGALLGDRLRMNSLKSNRCYMRSLATREANVSVSPATQESIKLLRAAGFDWIFVETGGIGQSDTSITDLTDVNLYIMTSEFGAPTQLEKINMLDYADIVVINKFDKSGSLDAITEVRRQFRRNHRELEKYPPSRYPVFGTIASRFSDPGVDAVFGQLIRLRSSDLPNPLLSTDYEPERSYSSSLVPKEKSLYLSEISRMVRDYRGQVESTVRGIQDWEASLLIAEKSGLSDSFHQELNALSTKLASSVDAEIREQLRSFEKLSERYVSDEFSYSVREKKISVPLFTLSLSQNKIRKIAIPRFKSKAETARFLMLENLPGYFPYTAGVFPFKRTEEDPKRQFAGEGTPARTNRRFHLLCAGEKAKRLSTAFDSVTLYGNDPGTRPDIFGKIGESGVSVCTLHDAKKLYAGFDLCDENTSVSMTINGPAPMLLAFFFNTAIDQQVDRFIQTEGRKPSADEYERIKAGALRRVRGTVQADILKEDQAQNTCIFSTEFAIRMMGDIQQYFIDHDVRNYYSVSVSGYHIAEAGANPITQLAFTLANGFTYVEYYLARGMHIDQFAPNFSFFFSNALDAEYTVIGRVARRIWALTMKYRYKANDRSQKLKYHIQTSGRSLHAQEISFNDIRTTLQALMAYFDHCNSLHTNAYDEAVTTPTEESVRRAMAIQMIISKEFGWAKNENPLQGSFFIEELTDLVEEAVLGEFDCISLRGGVLGAMETQYQRSKIQEESLHYEKQKHSGELPIVGVNCFISPSTVPELDEQNLTRASYAEKQSQIDSLGEFHRSHAEQAPKALLHLKETARSGKNVFEALLEASRVCSLGQMTEALNEIGGQYRRSV